MHKHLGNFRTMLALFDFNYLVATHAFTDQIHSKLQSSLSYANILKKTKLLNTDQFTMNMLLLAF